MSKLTESEFRDLIAKLGFEPRPQHIHNCEAWYQPEIEYWILFSEKRNASFFFDTYYTGNKAVIDAKLFFTEFHEMIYDRGFRGGEGMVRS